jgi:hypothetical protein
MQFLKIITSFKRSQNEKIVGEKMKENGLKVLVLTTSKINNNLLI